MLRRVKTTIPALAIQEAYDSCKNIEVTPSELLDKLKINAHQQEILANKSYKLLLGIMGYVVEFGMQNPELKNSS